MPDSDYEFVENASSDENRVSSSNYGTRSKGSAEEKTKRKKESRTKAAWEDIQRSWEVVVETEDGNLALLERIEADKRRRLLRGDTTPLQRGIIRHVMLVLDMSFAMAEKDMLPTRYLLVLNYAVEFVREYFEQNPISQLGIVGMRDGVAVRISDMSGNPAEHIERLREWHDRHEPLGNPSLQNSLEMCRGALFHAPSHGTREALVIYGALFSSDPGNIYDTITSLVTDRIHVSVVGLAAQVAICAEICAKTHGGDDPAGTYYNIAMHEQHLRELMLAMTVPPAATSTQQSAPSLLMMGFPDRTSSAATPHTKDKHKHLNKPPGKDSGSLGLCACHNCPVRQGYLCPRCNARVCRLPAECPVCSLTLILSTHLARSYHHLFPLRIWVVVSWGEAEKARTTACFGCLTLFPLPPKSIKAKRKVNNGHAVSDGVSNSNSGSSRAEEKVPAILSESALKGVSESGRYKCQVCGHHFCIDCDLYAHEVIHNCPGCQSDTRGLQSGVKGEEVSEANRDGNDPMAIDS